jgi:hypothetical protein
VCLTEARHGAVVALHAGLLRNSAVLDADSGWCQQAQTEEALARMLPAPLGAAAAGFRILVAVLTNDASLCALHGLAAGDADAPCLASSPSRLQARARAQAS